MENKKLQRSSNKMIAGVCGGLAEYLGIDVTLVRVIFALLAFFTGTTIIAYPILWLVMPEADSAAPPAA